MGPAFPFVKFVLTPRGHAGRRRRPPKISGTPLPGTAAPATPIAPTVSTACRHRRRRPHAGRFGDPTPGANLGTPDAGRQRCQVDAGDVPDESGRRRPPATFQNMGKQNRPTPPRPNESTGRPPPECPETGGVDVGSWPFWRSPRRRGPSNSPASTACDAPDRRHGRRRRHGRQCPKTKRGAFAPRRRCQV